MLTKESARMFATGDFERLKHDIVKRYENNDIKITFGILIADYDQSLAREYILNYLKIFNKKSDKYIDFFIPGYVPYHNHASPTKFIDTGKHRYYFSRELFESFIHEFEGQFDFEYSFNPVLVLVELEADDGCSQVTIKELTA